MKNCANCGSLQRSAADDGLCDVCAHQSLYAMREVVGEQQATIERLTDALQRIVDFAPYGTEAYIAKEALEEKR